MSPLEKEKARDRLHALRARLSDTCSLLETTARNSPDQDNDTRNNMRFAIRTIRAVIDDLETVCSDHLNDPADNSLLQATVSRAKSEVAAGEFDSQG